MLKHTQEIPFCMKPFVNHAFIAGESDCHVSAAGIESISTISSQNVQKWILVTWAIIHMDQVQPPLHTKSKQMKKSSAQHCAK